MRPLSPSDFRRILSLGLPEEDDVLPRLDGPMDDPGDFAGEGTGMGDPLGMEEARIPFEVEHDIVRQLTN